MKKSAAISILAIIILAGGILRFHNLFTQSIWLDEAAQLYIANQPSMSEFIHWMHVDQQPPLSHLFWYFWERMFQTPEHARILSAIVGILTIPLFFLLARELFSLPGALFSTLLLSLSAKHIWASQEARPYVFFIFFVCLSYYTFVLWLKRPERKRLFWYAAATVPALYTHYFAIFFIAPQTVFTILTFRKNIPLIKELIGAQIITGLLFVPWLPYFARTFTKIQTSNFWLGTPAPEQLHTIIISWAGGIIGILLIGYLTLRYIRDGDNKKYLVLLWLVLSASTPFLLSFYRPFFHERYIIPALLPIYLLAGGGFSKLTKVSRILFIAAVILLSITPIQAHYARTKDQWREAAAYVTEHFTPGEIILYEKNYGAYPFKTYFKGQAEHIPITNMTAIVANETITSSTGAVWLIVNTQGNITELSPALAAHFTDASKKIFKGVIVMRYSDK